MAVCALRAPGIAHSQELYATGRTGIDFSWMSRVRGSAPAPEILPVFGGGISLFAASYDLAIEAEIRVSEGGPPELATGTLSARFYPSEQTEIRLGRFPYLPGTAELSSPVDFAAAVDMESLFTGRIEEATLPSDALAGTLYAGPLYARLLILPDVPSTRLPHPESAWFPHAAMSAPAGTTLELEESSAEPAAPQGASVLEQLSYAAELGMTAGPVDLTWLAYVGRDPRAVLRVEGTYDETTGIAHGLLVPVVGRFLGMGLASVVELGALRLSLDAAHSPVREAMSTTIEVQPYASPPVPFRSTTVSSQWYAFSAGMAYHFPATPLSVSVEYSNDRYHAEGAVQYFLGHRTMGRVDWMGFDQRLLVSGVALVEHDGPSAAFYALVRYSASDATEIRLTTGRYVGASDTTLGQFSDNTVVTGAVHVRF